MPAEELPFEMEQDGDSEAKTDQQRVDTDVEELVMWPPFHYQDPVLEAKEGEADVANQSDESITPEEWFYLGQLIDG